MEKSRVIIHAGNLSGAESLESKFAGTIALNAMVVPAYEPEHLAGYIQLALFSDDAASLRALSAICDHAADHLDALAAAKLLEAAE